MSWADAPRRGERGFSLVESVIAVAVLGIIASAMVGGMATSIATSDIHREQSVVNTVMVSAAETVKTAAYVSCAAGGDASPPGNPSAGSYSTTALLPTGPPLLAAGVAPWPASAIRTTVQYWNPQTSVWEAACHDTQTGSRGPPLRTDGDGLGGPFPMQRITITVANPGNRASASVYIVKRGP